MVILYRIHERDAFRPSGGRSVARRVRGAGLRPDGQRRHHRSREGSDRGGRGREGATSFGTITTALDPRVVQLALKLVF